MWGEIVTLKIGDKVRVISKHHKYPDKSGKVVDFEMGEYRVKSEYFEWLEWYCADELELVESSRRVVCAAVRCSALELVIPCVRHCDVLFWNIFDKYEACLKEEVFEQGFVDNKGNFLTRQEAWKVAYGAGQIIRRCGGDTADGGTLYSECLY